jgi:hypothetical protein
VTIHHATSKERATTYHQHPNALSALDIHAMIPYHDLAEDDDDLPYLLYCRHLSLVHQNNFFFVLDSMLIDIEPDQVIPRLTNI